MFVRFAAALAAVGSVVALGAGSLAFAGSNQDSVKGQGKVVFEPGNFVDFRINARSSSDVQGHMHAFFGFGFPDPPFESWDTHVAVNCLVVQGNRVAVGGTVTASKVDGDPAPPDETPPSHVSVLLIDNGSPTEGASVDVALPTLWFGFTPGFDVCQATIGALPGLAGPTLSDGDFTVVDAT